LDFHKYTFAIIILPNPSPNPEITRHNIRANVLCETHGIATVDIDHKNTESSRIALPPNFLAAQAPIILIYQQ